MTTSLALGGALVAVQARHTTASSWIANWISPPFSKVNPKLPFAPLTVRTNSFLP
jgi:hypothetical protein